MKIIPGAFNLSTTFKYKQLFQSLLRSHLGGLLRSNSVVYCTAIIVIICSFRLILAEYLVAAAKKLLYTYKNQGGRQRLTQRLSGRDAS